MSEEKNEPSSGGLPRPGALPPVGNQKKPGSTGGLPVPGGAAKDPKGGLPSLPERPIAASAPSPNEPNPAVDAETVGDTHQKKAIHNRKPLLIGAVGIAVVSLGAVFFLVGGDEKKTDDEPKAPAISRTAPDPADNWYDDSEVNAPGALKPWQKAPAKEISRDGVNADQRSFANQKLLETDLHAQASSYLKSSEGGVWTSDPDKMMVDGLPNPAWTSVTLEDFVLEAALIPEFLLNPTYGDWRAFQFAGSDARSKANLNGVIDIFSEDYIQRNEGKKDKSYLPIYADWDDNDYGRKDLLPPSAGSRWYGEITGASLGEIKTDKGTLGKVFNVTYKVKFKALDLNKKVVEQDGTLKLTFVENPSRKAGDKDAYALLVDKASLTVK